MALACSDDTRLDRVHEAGLNGIDEVEVSDDRLHLCVHFLAGVPDDLRRENLRVEGGQRVRNIDILSIQRRAVDDDHEEECLELTLDRPGDPSEYRVCVVDVDEEGDPTGRPLAGFDQRYLCAAFRFNVDCGNTTDCAPDDGCPDPPSTSPVVDYLVRDYPGFRRLLLERMALLAPEWRERHVPDVGITLVELVAYVADHLAYAQDAVATEAYLGTANHRISIRRHARLVDYVLVEGCNARAFVTIEVDGAAAYSAPASELTFLTRFAGAPPPGTVLDGDAPPAQPHECYAPVTAAPDEVLSFHAARNTLEVWTWGDRECCLPAGTTSVCLAAGEDVVLEVGDLILFEEVLGPETGDPADADPTHRQVVRLSSVTPTSDDLYQQPLLEVAWDQDDALAFPVCLSSIGRPPECRPLAPVSVVRGNVVLVDHGCPRDEELDPVPDPPITDCCAGPCQTAEAETPVVDHRPSPLGNGPLTFAAPPPGTDEPAATMLASDPRSAVAALTLRSWGPEPDDAAGDGESWSARPDLLDSGPDDRHVVAEIDDEGRAHVRFGDDRLGEAPEPGTRFVAHYRVGLGRVGNVGAETIAFAARSGVDEHGVRLTVRNPLPATGGTDAEPIALARLLAPGAHRARRERAIVADDYAELAAREVTELQAAGATLRWTGSWYEVLVSVDQRGRSDPEPEVLHGVATALERYRRMGHDVAVAPAEQVPLEIRLSVCVAPHHSRAEIAAQLGATFSSGVRRDGRPGHFHPDQLLPGAPVAVSPIVAAAQAVEGVESVEVVVLRRLFVTGDAPPVPPDGLLRLGPREVALVDSDPIRPDRGGVELDLRGGR